MAPQAFREVQYVSRRDVRCHSTGGVRSSTDQQTSAPIATSRKPRRPSALLPSF